MEQGDLMPPEDYGEIALKMICHTWWLSEHYKQYKQLFAGYFLETLAREEEPMPDVVVDA